jgi:translation initiation factor IF-2
MQLSRHLLMTCAVATFLTPTLVHAYDNEAQIRARQALEEKMNQAGAQMPPATSAPPAVVVQPKPNPPVVTAPPAAAQPDAVRQALEEKMKEIQARTPAVTPPPPAKPKPAPKPVVAAPKPVVPKPEPPVVTVTPNSATVETPVVQATPTFAPEVSQPATPAPVTPVVAAPVMTTPSMDSDKLSQALHQKMSETASEPAVMPPQKPTPPIMVTVPSVRQNNTVTKPTPPAAPVTASAPAYAPIPESSNTARPALPETPTPTPTPEPTVGQNQSAPPPLSLPVLSGPPSSLSSTKQQKLDALLQQYRMDQLTPQQYHEQRAKVLSEP